MQWNVIGCGGLAYYAVPRLGGLVGMEDRVDLYDGDMVEFGNLGRQWGTRNVMQPKVVAMGGALKGLVADSTVIKRHEMFVDERTEYEWGRTNVFMALPDDNEVRFQTWRVVKKKMEEGTPIIYVTAGNDVITGWAVAVSSDLAGREAPWDWVKGLGLDKRKKEGKPEEEESCGRIEQSSGSNMLTVMLMWQIFETVMKDWYTGEGCHWEFGEWRKTQREGGVLWKTSHVSREQTLMTYGS